MMRDWTLEGLLGGFCSGCAAPRGDAWQPMRGAGAALGKAALWPVENRCHGRAPFGRGAPLEVVSGDRHELSIPGGGARGGQPRSKVSMMIMRPPQQGQGYESRGG